MFAGNLELLGTAGLPSPACAGGLVMGGGQALHFFAAFRINKILKEYNGRKGMGCGSILD